MDLTLDVMNHPADVRYHPPWHPRNLLVAAEEGVRSITGVVIQFPFYAGMQAMGLPVW